MRRVPRVTPADWGFQLTDVGPGALAALAITLLVWIVRRIITGDLVPRQTHEDVRAQRDAWRAHAERQADQLDDLVEGLRTTERVVASLPRRDPPPAEGGA